LEYRILIKTNGQMSYVTSFDDPDHALVYQDLSEAEKELASTRAMPGVEEAKLEPRRKTWTKAEVLNDTLWTPLQPIFNFRLKILELVHLDMMELFDDEHGETRISLTARGLSYCNGEFGGKDK